ncbi:MAG: hypothetical protein EBR82_51810, partial [Caulobacteraceae bacterium]|nr:hypothetical protein [Caulobacteraceae bacterium]
AIQPWVKVATDNQDKILQIEQWIADQQKKPVDPTPVVKPDPTIEALKEQIRLQNEAIQKLLHPNPPVVVTPVLPSAIKATDSQGKPITGDIPEGRQFRITGDVGTWTILPATSPDIDVEQYPDHLTCVLRNGAVLTVVHSSGSPITTSSLIVKCLKAANPPPVVVVPDPVTPVVDGKPRALIVYESSDGSYTKEQLQALNSTTVAAALGSQTAGWRKWDKDLSASSESAPWPDIWAAVKPKAIEAGLPAVAVIRGNSIKVHSISNEADILAALGGK